ncbi:MAG: methyl-accepting chemotaxis protein [Leptospirales bacterium]
MSLTTTHNYSLSRKYFNLGLLLQTVVFFLISYARGEFVLPVIAIVITGFVLLVHVFTSGDHLKEGILYVVSLLFISTVILLFSVKTPGIYIYYSLISVLLVVFLRQWLLALYGIAGFFFLLYGWINSNITAGVFGENAKSSELLIALSIFLTGMFFSWYICKQVLRWLKSEEPLAELSEQKENSVDLDHYEIPYLMYLKPVADNIRRLSKEIEKSGTSNKIRLSGQKEKIIEVESVVKNLGDSFHDTSDIIKQVKRISSQCRTIAKTSAEEIHVVLEMVKQMVKIVDATRKHVADLKESTRRVENVIKVIDKISHQTRLLALNASIEAARFGADQHGFVMVADEVKVLSVLTQLSVQDITNTVRDIKIKTKAVEDIINQEVEESVKGLDIARLGEQSVKYVDSILGSLEMEVEMMEEEFVTNRESAIAIIEQFSNIKVFVEENSKSMNELLLRIDDMKLQTENVMTIVKSCDLDAPISKQNDLAFMYGNRVIMECETIFENGIASKDISMEDLYSREYEPFEEGLGLYHSKHDKYIETHLQKVLDKYLEKVDNFVYFYIMDSKGYIPVHNSIYSQELTGDIDKDEKLHRPKRISQDYASTLALKNDDIFLLQCVRHSSETEPVMDMSIPFFFRDKQWGVVRVGFVYT